MLDVGPNICICYTVVKVSYRYHPWSNYSAPRIIASFLSQDGVVQGQDGGYTFSN